MAKMWAGRTAGETDRIADDFNSSIHFDSRMYREDITGSMAHAAMLASKHIITAEEADTLIDGLQGLKIIRLSLAPSVLAAKAYSLPLSR